MLSGQETHAADPFSLSGYACPAITVLMLYLVEFYKRDPGVKKYKCSVGASRTEMQNKHRNRAIR